MKMFVRGNTVTVTAQTGVGVAVQACLVGKQGSVGAGHGDRCETMGICFQRGLVQAQTQGETNIQLRVVGQL